VASQQHIKVSSKYRLFAKARIPQPPLSLGRFYSAKWQLAGKTFVSAEGIFK